LRKEAKQKEVSMKIARYTLLLALLTGMVSFSLYSAPSLPLKNPTVVCRTLDPFYHRLRPYGEWIQLSPYGSVWRPLHIEKSWRPYTVGRWVFTDFGWTWVSNEPWAWACYHYGRWFFDDFYGWLWYPDLLWAPAWVAWRFSPGYIGWAPLPPQVQGCSRVSINSYGINLSSSLSSHTFVFVASRQFLSSNLFIFLLSSSYNRAIIPSSTFFFAMKERSPGFMTNHFPDERMREIRAGRQIPKYRVETRNSYTGPLLQGDRVMVDRYANDLYVKMRENERNDRESKKKRTYSLSATEKEEHNFLHSSSVRNPSQHGSDLLTDSGAYEKKREEDFVRNRYNAPDRKSGEKKESYGQSRGPELVPRLQDRPSRIDSYGGSGRERRKREY